LIVLVKILKSLLTVKFVGYVGASTSW